MRRTHQIRSCKVAGQLAMLTFLWTLGGVNAIAQESEAAHKVAQLEEIVASQQQKIERLEARLAKLEEISRILRFDQHAEAKQRASRPGPVQPNGKPVTATTALKVGTPVLVEWKNKWWNGSVLELLPRDAVKIHYEGWEAKYDEVVARARLLLPSPSGSVAKQPSDTPAATNLSKAEEEVRQHYAAAHPEIQEYILWTARSFGRSGLWLNEDAFANLDQEASDHMIAGLAALFEEGEYGRHLCPGLARASALRDERLVPGLMKVAGYHREEGDYDCRPKWMAVAALARQESEAAVPLLVSLIDHGNQNTRKWARAALSRKTGQDFQAKQAWADWWQTQGHQPIDERLLKPWKASQENTAIAP